MEIEEYFNSQGHTPPYEFWEPDEWFKIRREWIVRWLKTQSFAAKAKAIQRLLKHGKK
jgi:hypothetical protein